MLVDVFQPLQLLLQGDAVAGVEGETGDGAEQRAFVVADVAAVEHIDMADLLVGGP